MEAARPQVVAMCGIVGFLDKRAGSEHAVGSTLLAMLQALSCRGPDSAGVAVFGEPSDWSLRISVSPRAARAELSSGPQGGTPIWSPSPDEEAASDPASSE